jgi:hypothetical protein
MLAPGVPSAKVADAIARGGKGWAQDVVDVTMRARYGSSSDTYHPAAAFDVFDLDPAKLKVVRDAVGDFNAAVASLPHHGDGPAVLRDIRSDVAAVKGMVRFDRTADMPWHADRPAIAVYDRVASDDRLSASVRDCARRAADAVRSIVLAHGEASEFGPFHASYADAAGPTTHVPTTRRSYDGWADAGVTETHNEFFAAVDGRDFARAIGSFNAEQDRAGDAIA